MQHRLLHAGRNPRQAGMQPRAAREKCAYAPWGDVRPIGASAGIGVFSKDSDRQHQRGRMGMAAP